MACKLEIEKTINKSIDNKIGFAYRNMFKKEATEIVNYLNRLWESNVVRLQGIYGGQYQIIKNPLTEAVEKEYIKQKEAEDKFSRDLDFFNKDAALYEQETREKDIIETAPIENSVAEVKNKIDSNKTLFLFDKMMNAPQNEIDEKLRNC